MYLVQFRDGGIDVVRAGLSVRLARLMALDYVGRCGCRVFAIRVCPYWRKDLQEHWWRESEEA